MDINPVSISPLRQVIPAGDERATQGPGPAALTEPRAPEAVRPGAEVPELRDRPDERPPGALTEEEQAVVQKLKARDREVRAHEQAHKLVAGPYAGAISYDYQRGPDGNRYAVGGSVPIDVSAEGTPEETAAKMQVVIKAALAPAEPSAADRAIAAAAQAQLREAQAEIAAERARERRGEPGAGEASRTRAAYTAAAQQPEPAAISVSV